MPFPDCMLINYAGDGSSEPRIGPATIVMSRQFGWLDRCRWVKVSRRHGRRGAHSTVGRGDGPMRTSTWMGLGFSGALLLVASAHGARKKETVGVEPVL